MDGLKVVFWLIVLLALYETGRVIFALKNGEKLTVIIKEGIAAAAIIAAVGIIIYIWVGFFK